MIKYWSDSRGIASKAYEPGEANRARMFAMTFAVDYSVFVDLFGDMQSSRRFVKSQLALFAFLPLSFLPFSSPPRASVTLSWEASPDKRVISYRIYYADMTGMKAVKAKSLDVGSTTHVTISNLVAGHTYYFAARALDSKRRESDPSNLVKYIVPSGASKSR